MIELGQLERRHEEFTQRHARVLVISMEDPETARKTQADFPHLLVLADAGRGLTDAVGLVHPGAGREGEDVDAPTTILVDRHGTVRWLHRTALVIARLSPEDVEQAIDQHLAAR